LQHRCQLTDEWGDALFVVFHCRRFRRDACATSASPDYT
jgi:hypothetical protein